MLIGTAVLLVVALDRCVRDRRARLERGVVSHGVVSERAVDSELTSVATIEPVAQATVGFPTTGTVKSVSVKVGDEVAAGDTLAQLDTELARDAAALGPANAGAGRAHARERSQRSEGNHFPKWWWWLGRVRSASVTSDSSTTRIVFTAAQLDPELEAAQKAVLDAQQAVDTALTTASTAYDTAVTVCTAQNARC